MSHVSELYFFLRLTDISLCECTIFVYLFISFWTSGLAHLRATVNCAVMNILVQVFMWIYVFHSLE